MESEKDLSFYWRSLRRRWIIIVLLPLIATLASGIISYYSASKSIPIYIAKTTLVMNKPVQPSEPTDKLDVNSILSSPQIAKILEPIAKSRNVEEKVIEYLSLPMSVDQLDSKVSVRSIQESGLIVISVQDSDAILAADIANAFAAKFSEVVVNTVSILDTAIPPVAPIPVVNKNQLIIIAFFSALLGAMSIAFFLEYLDDTLKNSEEIKKVLGLPVIGKIPLNTEVTIYNSKSLAAEAYRTLGTNIDFVKFPDEKKRILITSTGHSEGKSIVAVNLAISLVQTGKRVLIIDANLRNPIQHTFFKLYRSQGLSSTLASKWPSLDPIVHTHIQALNVFPSGPIPPNPTELLASDNMKSVLNDAAEAYDVVIIDSPPTVAIADVSILAQIVDGVILVVGAGEVSREYALEAKEQLQKVEAKIIGVVLNKTDINKKDSKYLKGLNNKNKKELKRSKLHNPSIQNPSIQNPSQQISV